MSVSRYLEYKRTGVEWLGEVPVHWDVIKGRRLFCQKREPSHPKDEQLSATQKYGVIPQQLFMELEDQKVTLALGGLDNFKHVEKGDFVISLRSFQGGIERCLYSGCVSPAYTVLRANLPIYGRYWAFLLKCSEYIAALQSYTDGIREGKNISYDQFGQIELPLPPLVEQTLIATFLDREIAKIDDLVKEQDILIALLKEKRQAVIANAVTKGLDPTVPMKDSGLEWIEEVPEHWEVSRIKYVSEFVTSGSRGWAQFYSESGPIFIRIGNYSNRETVNLDLSDIQHVSPPSGSEGERTLALEDDVLISITANLGATAVIPKGLGEAYVNQHTALVRPRNQKINSRWLAYSIAADYVQNQIQLSTQGGTKEGLSLDDVCGITLLVPPKSEQDAIVEFLDSNEKLNAEAMALLQRQSNLLLERRTALISAAVTGKIDVRQLVQEEVKA